MSRKKSVFPREKNSNKSISNLTETLATRPEGWSRHILKDVFVLHDLDGSWAAPGRKRISLPDESSNIAVGLLSPQENFFCVTFRSISALPIYDFSLRGAHNLHSELRHSSDSYNNQVPGKLNNRPVRRQHMMCNHVHSIVFARSFFTQKKLCSGSMVHLEFFSTLCLLSSGYLANLSFIRASWEETIAYAHKAFTRLARFVIWESDGSDMKKRNGKKKVEERTGSKLSSSSWNFGPAATCACLQPLTKH